MRHATTIILIALFACAEDYESKPLQLEKLIFFDHEPGELELFADGYATIDISVTIDSDTDQSVTFTTDQGGFIGTGSEQKTITVTSVNKKASVTLRADRLPNEEVPVTASITKSDKTYTNKTSVTFKTARPKQLFISTNKINLPADQSTTATLTVISTRGDGNSKVSRGINLDITVTKVAPSDLIEVDFIPFIKTPADEMTSLTFTIKSLNDKTGAVNVVVSTKNDDDAIITATRQIVFQ